MVSVQGFPARPQIRSQDRAGVRGGITEIYKSRFSLPIIHGFVSIKSVFLNGQTLDWAIISRRSIHRAGTRYFIRGADVDGNVANYVETEQLVIYNRSVASFVLTRGSIPFIWTQRPNIKYKPKPVVSTVDDQLRVFKRHIDEQIVLYGRQVLGKDSNIFNETER